MLDRLCRVDWNNYRTQRKNGKIGQGPFRPVFGNYRDAVARLYTESRQPERDAANTLDHLRAGQIRPHVADLISKSVFLNISPKRLDAKMRHGLRQGVETN